MRRLVMLTAAVASVVSLTHTGFADELWKYYFIANGSRPYYRPCGDGDCAFGGTRADLAGTFSISLNWQTNTGRLVAVEDQLVNMAGIIYHVPEEMLMPLLPGFSDHGIYTYSTTPDFGPGMLTSNGSGWRLISDGQIPLEGNAFRQGSPYDISFGLSYATLSLTVTNQWYGGEGVRVTGAPAVLYSAGVAGDFTRDKRVDARDYVAWRKSSGSQADYNLWRTYFGSAPPATTSGLPEPSLAALCVAAAAVFVPTRRRRPGAS